MNARSCWRSALLSLAPILVVLAIFWLLPSGQYRIAEDAKLRRFAASLLYDRGDLACFAQRGLNAQQGRRAGRPQTPLILSDREFEAYLDSSPPPEERYFLDYPHWAAWLFGLGWSVQELAGQTIHPPPAVLDAAHNNVANHVPRTPGERQLWHQYVTASRFYLLVFLLGTLVLIAILRTGYGDQHQSGRGWLLLLPATLFICFSRYDILPAVFVAGGLAMLSRQRWALSGLLLGAATLLKVYPVFLVPLLARYLWPRRHALASWTSAYAATLGLALAPLLFGEDWQGLLGPYRYQLFRPAEPGFTFYGIVLPAFMAEGLAGSLFRFGTLGILLAVLLRRPIDDMTTLLRRGAILLLYLISVAVFYSPQWIVWLAPFLIPLACRSARLVGLIVALDLVSYAVLPGWFLLKAVLPGFLPEHEVEILLAVSRLALVCARFAIVVLTLLVLAAPGKTAARKQERLEPAASFKAAA